MGRIVPTCVRCVLRVRAVLCVHCVLRGVVLVVMFHWCAGVLVCGGGVSKVVVVRGGAWCCVVLPGNSS